MVTSDPKCAPYIPKLLTHYKNLKWVHSMFAGVDKFLNQKEINDNNEIILTNARGAFAEPLAEFTILSMLHFNYNVPIYMESQSQHKWTKLTNTMINKRTLLIIIISNLMYSQKPIKNLEEKWSQTLLLLL